MKRILNLLFLATFIFGGFASFAQSNCSNYVRYHAPTHPYKYSSLSKSATCTTGKNYKFVLPLSSGKSYRISFYASTIFNNRVEFKLSDAATGEIINLPGDKKQFDDLSGYFNNANDFDEVLVKGIDAKTFKSLPYPFFEIAPATATNLEVEINILEPEKGGEKRGCIGVFIQDKLAPIEEGDGFN